MPDARSIDIWIVGLERATSYFKLVGLLDDTCEI